MMRLDGETLMRLLIPILVLFACTPSLPEPSYYLAPKDRKVVEVTREVWDAHESLPTTQTKTCDEAMLFLRVAVVGDSDFTSYCGACPPGNCPDYRASNICPRGCALACFKKMGRWYVSVQHESLGPELAPHELLHALELCTGLGYGFQHHGDERIWGDDGILRQVKARLKQDE